jgi:hypothetical protein
LTEKKGVVVTEAQLADIVSRVSPAAAAELHRRGASTVFVDVAGMSGWDARQLAWIAAELPRRVGAQLEKAGFKLSKNCATQNTPPPETNTNVPVVKRFDLRPAPDLVVVLSVSLTSAPGAITMCVQPPSEFLNSRPCDQRQSFEVRGGISGMEKKGKRSIGSARMEEDGTIVLELRAEGPKGLTGDALLTYPPGHPDYKIILRHLGGLKKGEIKRVPPWP